MVCDQLMIADRCTLSVSIFLDGESVRMMIL